MKNLPWRVNTMSIRSFFWDNLCKPLIFQILNILSEFTTCNTTSGCNEIKLRIFDESNQFFCEICITPHINNFTWTISRRKIQFTYVFEKILRDEEISLSI